MLFLPIEMMAKTTKVRIIKVVINPNLLLMYRGTLSPHINLIILYHRLVVYDIFVEVCHLHPQLFWTLQPPF